MGMLSVLIGNCQNTSVNSQFFSKCGKSKIINTYIDLAVILDSKKNVKVINKMKVMHFTLTVVVPDDINDPVKPESLLECMRNYAEELNLTDCAIEISQEKAK